MRRILSVLAVAAILVAVGVAAASPAFASRGGSGGGGAIVSGGTFGTNTSPGGALGNGRTTHENLHCNQPGSVFC